MKKLRIVNRKRFVCFIASVIILPAMLVLTVDFLRFPESYMPVERKALTHAIESGDSTAIELYERVYKANGRDINQTLLDYLFD